MSNNQFANGNKNVAGDNISIISPAYDGFDITPADSTDFETATTSIYVGVDGAVKLTTIGGTTLTFNSLIGGTILPVRAVRVFATGTTATNLIGLL